MTAPPSPTTEWAVIVAMLTDVKDDVKVVREQLDRMPERFVSRGEWGQRNEHVTTQLMTHGREIGQLRSDLANRRAPWWSTWTVVLSAAALAWAILGPGIRGG
jgi:hypothetical protein